jgi:glycosyltransferase involved in cell wall biosynthesis
MYHEGLGIGRYIAKLITHLEKVEGGHTFVIFLTKKNWNAYQPSDARFRKVCIDITWYTIAEQMLFPFVLYWHRIELMHFPHMNIPILYGGRFIVTIHDCILIKHPRSATSAASTRNPLFHAIKYRAYRCVIWSALHRARHIIAVSQSVKKDIMMLFAIPSEAISVIYEAAERLPSPGACAMLEQFRTTDFIFYAGNAYPHKNLDGLISAFEMLHRARPALSLLLCGQEDFFQKRFVSAIHTRGLSDAVIHLGSVSDACLSWLYTHARAYIFPSFEEGFGLPAVESFIHGCPVLASDIPVLREICGSAALYFDPHDVPAIARAIERILDDEALRSSLADAGSRRSAIFSWTRLAQQTFHTYTQYG